MATNTPKPRRSALFMPGSNARALEKAKTLKSDIFIFDLEDAVGPTAKGDAREKVCAALASKAYGKREICVRMNGLETGWGEDDLAAIIPNKPDAVLFPKIETTAQIDELETALDRVGAPKDLPVWIMIETPLAILNLNDIAARANDTRLTGLVLGSNDIAKGLGVKRGSDRMMAYGSAIQHIVLAARSYGLLAFDGVYNNFKDADGFQAECVQGRALGFDGKTLIHPAQLETCNQIFAPDEAEVKRANAIVSAYAALMDDGIGAINVDGEMVERLHLEEAEQVIAKCDAIKANDE